MRYLLPLSYVFGTRLRSARSLAATAVLEWIPGVAFLGWLGDLDPWLVPLWFFASWAVFTSLYELGYMMNDLYSVRHEAAPRRRTDARPGPVWAVVWTGVRLGVVGAAGVGLGWGRQPAWVALMGAVVPIYLAHNLLRRADLKTVTFVGLATLRYLAPLTPFVAPAALAPVLVPALLCYVLFRTLSYMESKELLQMPERSTSGFRVGFYALLLPLSAGLGVLVGSPLPVAANLYYLAFNGLFALRSRGRAESGPASSP